jgi:hypothetical protein
MYFLKLFGSTNVLLAHGGSSELKDTICLDLAGEFLCFMQFERSVSPLEALLAAGHDIRDGHLHFDFPFGSTNDLLSRTAMPMRQATKIG